MSVCVYVYRRVYVMLAAVLIDVENTCFKHMKLIMKNITDVYPNIKIKRAYGDFSKTEQRAWKDVCLENSLVCVQQFSFVTKRGSSDVRMCIDAMDMLHTNPEIDVFCIVTSDSDLAMRLREAEKVVYGIGKQQTPNPFVQACNTFNFIETMEERELQQTCSDDTRLNHILQVIHEHAPTNGVMNLSFLKEKMVELGYDRRIKMKPLISAYSKHIKLVCLPNHTLFVSVRKV